MITFAGETCFRELSENKQHEKAAVFSVTSKGQRFNSEEMSGGEKKDVGPTAGPAARAQCIVVYVLKEAAAPESEEFEVSAKSAVHRRLASLFPYLY
ncbi:Extracellular phospholipase C [Dissostichus eleginoides]|uniref:Extracellular phospholipase C n=1 Tax=Dissostichus eleginoides TaxID=100907 RepID=A0AAD9B9B2_DISEL|nr:Extracellular phospholipase C [Dissostichus eleginoides]